MSGQTKVFKGVNIYKQVSLEVLAVSFTSIKESNFLKNGPKNTSTSYVKTGMKNQARNHFQYTTTRLSVTES